MYVVIDENAALGSFDLAGVDLYFDLTKSVESFACRDVGTAYLIEKFFCFHFSAFRLNISIDLRYDHSVAAIRFPAIEESERGIVSLLFFFRIVGFVIEITSSLSA